jgi:hypothetical protein
MKEERKKCDIIILRNLNVLQMFKRTYERWGLKDGEGKLRIETSGGE